MKPLEVLVLPEAQVTRIMSYSPKTVPLSFREDSIYISKMGERGSGDEARDLVGRGGEAGGENGDNPSCVASDG